MLWERVVVLVAAVLAVAAVVAATAAVVVAVAAAVAVAGGGLCDGRARGSGKLFDPACGFQAGSNSFPRSGVP